MQTLVTGGTGFIGRRITTALLDRGDRVRVMLRDPSCAPDLSERGAELVRGDMTDPATLRSATAGIECVYHTAAAVGDWLDPKLAKRVNVDGTRDLLNACKAAGVRRVVHLSSLSVLGTKHHHGTDESAPYGYGDPYTDTKAESEKVVRGYAARGELDTVCLRPGFVYGPGDHQVIPSVLNSLATRQFRFVGDGSKQMNTIYIDDVAQAALLADQKPEAAGQVYNLTDDQRTTIKEFITFMANYLHVPVPARSLPVPLAVVAANALESFARLTHAKKPPLLNRSRLRFLYYNQYYSVEKARRELGYAPRFTYREGLPLTLDWFRETGQLPAEITAAAGAAGSSPQPQEAP
jgi:nucleoside-diphosphate-sugar epimerase